MTWFGWLGWLGLAVDFQQSVPFLKKKELINLQNLFNLEPQLLQLLTSKIGVMIMNLSDDKISCRLYLCI